jgi:hypothetical protein
MTLNNIIAKYGSEFKSYELNSFYSNFIKKYRHKHDKQFFKDCYEDNLYSWYDQREKVFERYTKRRVYLKQKNDKRNT